MARKAKATLEETLVDKLARLEKENAELKMKQEEQGDNVGIRLDEYIEVMSLYPGKLNLSTERLGKGRQFSFSQFGETKRILYNDLASVFENYRTFMEQGYFYIMNPKVIRKHGLDDIYAKILNKETIEKIVSCDPKLAIKLYEGATKGQRETIEGMLVQAIKDDEADLNIVSQISKIASKDLIALAEDAKKLEQLSM